MPVNLSLAARPCSVRHVAAPEALAAIHDPSINAVIWARGAGPDVSSLLDQFCAEGHDHAPCLVAADCDALELDAALSARGVGASPERAALAADLAGLARRFARVMEASRIKVRVERLARDGCRLFHTDFVSVRLITTYAGPGTLILPDAAVRRAGLGKGDNARIVMDPTAVVAVPTRAVALLKGEAYPGSAGRGCVHRSPPVAGTGAVRLVVAMDPAT